MRIIGGKHRSKKLKFNKTNEVRPTSDNVREAVFNMLYDVSGLVVLDLFSGSGSYGFEAISRGAKMVYFNDLNSNNTSIIKSNIKTLNETNSTVVLNLDYEKAISYLIKKNIKFDLIFLDPPYYKDYYMKSLELLERVANDYTKVVIEIDKSLSLDFLSPSRIEKDKVYGKKRIIIYNI